MLASTADSTLSSSLNAAIDASLSGSGVDGDRTSVWAGPQAPWASVMTGMGLGGKKDEETRTVLRRRLSSSSICFFSWRMEARSSESVSIRPSGKQENTEGNDHENIYWSHWPFLCSLVTDLWKTTSGNSSKWYDKYICLYTFIFLLLLHHVFELLCEIIDDLFFLEFLPGQNSIEVCLGVNSTE